MEHYDWKFLIGDQLGRKYFFVCLFGFFHAMYLSLNILQICFHFSGVLFLISLIKCHETAFSYLSILTLTAEVLRGNGPSRSGTVKP